MKRAYITGINNYPVVRIEELLEITRQRRASDLHLTANMPPMLRIAGELVGIEGYDNLSPEDIKQLVCQILSIEQMAILEEKFSIDQAINIGENGRFRVNAYYQRGCISCALRRLADNIPVLEELGLPESVYKIPDFRNGLVLVTGATGSGKTTTLAAIIARINERYRRNIITIEDPIEYLHSNCQSIVNQRELFTDVDSFANALRSALRADPDVILVGEMRDLETIRVAITAAETGHLVFSTLHSRDAVSSINRIIGVFPAEEQAQIRQQLSVSLKAIIAQQLLPCIDGYSRVLAAEVMMVTPAISNLIRLGRTEQINLILETGNRQGMQTMEQCLERLVKEEGIIDTNTALNAANNLSLMKNKLKIEQSGEC